MILLFRRWVEQNKHLGETVFPGDLKGCERTGGETAGEVVQMWGVLKDVIETGANDVYIITLEDGKELLIPAIKECILNVDIENKKMEVHVMEGLRD